MVAACFVPTALRAAEALLIPEVITREVGIHVGGVQTPEIKYLETREVGLFNGAEPEPPYQQVETREVSLVVCDPAAPPRIEDFTVSISPTGSSVTLDWSQYDRYAVRDVARFDIYYSDHPFSSIEGMTPFASVGGEFSSWTRDGFPEWQDHFFAIVPVDGLGHADSNVVYSAAYPLMPEVVTREVGLFNGAEPEPPYRQVETREVSLVVCDPAVPPRIEDFTIAISPTGSSVTLDWGKYDRYAVRDVARYDIYYADHAFSSTEGMTPFASVGGEFSTWSREGFPEWQDHFFAVVPVDGLGHADTNVIYSAAYPLMPEVVTREVGLFNGAEPEPPYKMVETREVGIVVADGTTPAPVTGPDKAFAANISRNRFGAVNLDWSDYDLWAQRDVVRYRIYYNDRFFSNVSDAYLAGFSQDGRMSTMVQGLTQKKVYYFAVVAEDSSGNFNPVVYSRSTRDPIPTVFDYALDVAVTGGDSLTDLGIDWSIKETTMEYNYRRKVSALQSGTHYNVEWSEDLEHWSTVGVEQSVLDDNGIVQHVQAFITRTGKSRMFVRLKVTVPD